MKKDKKIALLGQPNSGKSTIFNALTGAHQHVGNWPGKTVEKIEGEFVHNNISYFVADLPGTYSLSANSDEEIITRNYIASKEADLVYILADSCFYSTCSTYFIQAVEKHGIFKGSYLGIKRVLRCHPFNPGGYDPVP